MSEKFEHPEVFKKYAKTDISGREAINNKDIREFKEIPENWGDHFSVALLPDEESREIINERLVAKIEQMEKDLGIKFLLAGRDSPIHSTILSGKFEASESGEGLARDSIFGTIEGQILHSGLAETLSGQEIKFEYVLLDKGNILLTSVQIPETVLRTRDELAAVYSANGLKPISYQNILHITVARISSLPKDAEKMKEYKKRMIALRHEVSSNPVIVRVKDIYSGAGDKLVRGDTK